jgi:hypothetical protein
MLSEDSVVAWALESTFKTAPGGTWNAFGRVTDWKDLGPHNAITKEPIAGAGREAHSIFRSGISYGGTIPFQVVDPKILGLAWGQEPAVPVALGGGYYRHTLQPTQRGILPSIAIQMRDKTGEAVAKTDKTTYLGAICKGLALRGEEPGEDGGNGRLMAALDLLPHDDDDTVSDKSVSLSTLDPYRYHHGRMTLFGGQVYRILDWELTLDNAAKHAYYWQDTTSQKPFEAPPENISYEFSGRMVADGQLFGGVTPRKLAQQATTGNGTLYFYRTAGQDEFQINLVDMMLEAAPRSRSHGKVIYEFKAHVRSTGSSGFQWVDQSNTQYFPA